MDDQYIQNLWNRAVEALATASKIVEWDCDGASNRAYYSAFHAVSALFALEGVYFKKHAGIQSAVHKNLVHAGRWPKELGSDYDDLLKFRDVADYGALARATPEMAGLALAAAFTGRII